MRGFTLVEMSIVIVILGLLVGGILAGQSLIRASELRSISTQVSAFKTAIITFKDTYSAYPGDMDDATRFWSRQVSATHCVTNSAALVNADGVCDGDGNGIMSGNGGASQAGEIPQLWRHLVKAGLVEGDYTGLWGSTGHGDVRIGENGPRSKISNVGYYLNNWNNSAGTTSASYYAIDYGNNLTVGTNGGTGWTDNAFLTPEEAWNIDTKMDDGLPGAGDVVAIWWNPCTLSISATDTGKGYELANSGKVCAIRFRNFF